MRVLEKGHTYELRNKRFGSQKLTFFKDLPDNKFEEHHDGVLCQEVLRALIDRVNVLHVQVPCKENVDIVNNLRNALLLFETRAARRTLEKSYKKTGMHIEELPTHENGHVFDL